MTRLQKKLMYKRVNFNTIIIMLQKDIEIDLMLEKKIENKVY